MAHAYMRVDKILQAIAFIVSIASVTASPTYASEFDHHVGTILFPAPNASQFGYAATWAKTPTDAEIRDMLPASVTIEGRTHWACHVHTSGQLYDCVMELAWPDDRRYETAGRKLLNRFVLSQVSSQAAQTNNAKVVFDIYFYGDGLSKPPVDQCPAPFCSAVPPPPPPPASTSK